MDDADGGFARRPGAVAVTGVSGALGRLVAEALEHDERVTRVVGIDDAEPAYATRNLEFYRMDVRSPRVRDALAGCSAVVHLASRPSRDEAEARSVAVDGTRNVLLAAAESGVAHAACASSTMVYGAHADNPVPLEESAPLRPNAGFAASAHAAEAELVVQSYRESSPGVTVATMRLAPVVGTAAPPALLEAPFVISVRGHDPLVQVTDARDAADALVWAASHGADGAFNVASGGALPLSRAFEVAGLRRIELSRAQAERALQAAWSAGLSGVPRAALPALLYPVVASAERLRAAGFVPARTAESCLIEAADAARGWLRIGPVRIRPRQFAVAAGAVGASLLARRAAARTRAR